MEEWTKNNDEVHSSRTFFFQMACFQITEKYTRITEMSC